MAHPIASAVIPGVPANGSALPKDVSPEVWASMSPEAQKLMAEAMGRARKAEEALSAQRNAKLSLKVGAKGGVSVYGLGRWPVSLYASQWERLIAEVPAIKAFIADNANLLSRKG